VLALASAIRPTSLAAVYALLAGGSPRRLMTVYVLAGLTFTLAIGVLIVWVFNGVSPPSTKSHTRAVAEIVGGVLAIVFGALVLAGRVGGRRGDEDAPRPPRRWAGMFDRHLTAKSAALAGPATHIPGIFYLVALNLIVTHRPSLGAGLLDVVIYNLVWFAVPIAALAVCIVRPETARDVIHDVNAWARRHAHGIMLVASFGVGAALLIHGLLTL
jgi:Sap, sulfolipid-1-addressing protein